MIVVRPIRASDLDFYHDIAVEATIGITNLPKDRKALEKKIEVSLRSFKQSSLDNDNYVFVLEDLSNHKIVGTSAIYSKVGVDQHKYFYRLESTSIDSSVLNLKKEMKVLRVVSDGIHSEICALCLKPEFRGGGLGRLLSLSRFLFMASFLERFQDTTISELRGIINEDGSSPFWEAVGRKFIDMPLEEIIKNQQKDPRFIPDILPKWPVYVDFLPESVQNALGKIHHDTNPALKMLTKEGFQLTTDLDVFESGPKLEVKTHEIRTIKSCIFAEVESIKDKINSNQQFMISNAKLDFRACYANFDLIDSSKVSLPRELAEVLMVREGDKICYDSQPIEIHGDKHE